MTEIIIQKHSITLPDNYFLPRDFEIVQPIYDLAFLLKLKSTAAGSKEPAYRVLSLNKAAHNLDGYSTSVSRWIEGNLNDDNLDYVPTPRIRNQLAKIKETGTIQELQDLMSPQAEGCLRLRSIRGFGPAQIAKFLGQESEPPSDLLTSSAKKCGMPIDNIMGVFQGRSSRKWQAAHIVPPLLRLLKSIENLARRKFDWHLIGIPDAISVIEDDFKVHVEYDEPGLSTFVAVIEKEPFFHLKGRKGSSLIVQHQMGWYFEIGSKNQEKPSRSLEELAWGLDPLIRDIPSFIRSDLHTHTSWSDGVATPDVMIQAATRAGLEYIAITDHSRSSKLQRGLTPSVWLRQAMSLHTLRGQNKVLHGMEVDILPNGDMDMPDGILCGMDLIVASFHSGWGGTEEQNTERIINAIETGYVDIIGHPTTALMGRPGSPSYVRAPIAVDWDRVFAHCSKWQVALEVNCFPSRLDISSNLLKQAINAGCWISLGSDAHSRIHQDLIKFGIAIIDGEKNVNILNSLNFKEIELWLKHAREARKRGTKTKRSLIQGEIFAETISPVNTRPVLLARYNGRPRIPQGAVVVGIDLTAGKNRKTAVAKMSGNFVETASFRTDEDILDYIKKAQPAIVSIDSPLGLPGGGDGIDSEAGIMRIAERDLASVGIPAYPALIDSMKQLTLRGIRLRKMIESFDAPPIVIESYPGAAQDLFAIPRKQRGLNLLLSGLIEMGLSGPGLLTKSHDELDAITSAIVGRFFEAGQYEAMGIPSEAQLIVPKTSCLIFDKPPIICLYGKPGSGKSVVSRYLALYYGFHWIKTREIILNLIRKDPINISSCNMAKLPCNSFEDINSNETNNLYLSKHSCELLRDYLIKTLSDIDRAIVIDSILDLKAFDCFIKQDREIYIWYLCRQSSKISKYIPQDGTIIKDRLDFNHETVANYDLIKDHADFMLYNSSTLENLHRLVDNTLFSQIIAIKRISA